MYTPRYSESNERKHVNLIDTKWQQTRLTVANYSINKL